MLQEIKSILNSDEHKPFFDTLLRIKWFLNNKTLNFARVVTLVTILFLLICFVHFR